MECILGTLRFFLIVELYKSEFFLTRGMADPKIDPAPTEVTEGLLELRHGYSLGNVTDE